MITRRSLLVGGIFSTGAAFGGGAAAALTRLRLSYPHAAPNTPTAPLSTFQPRPSLALSLRQYQKELKRAFGDVSEIQPSLRELHGINRVDGFLLEPDGDVVLLGANDAALPVMVLDDLLVALRNAYSTSAEYAGAPGCTIDPTPGAADPWKEQIVKVFGGPASNPMGNRFVAVDYEMKKVAAGLITIHPAIPSIYEASRARSAPCQKTGGALPAPLHSTHRFWFTPQYPERPRFIQDEQTVWIQKPINVRLQSEEEFLSDGRRVGGAPPQPDAVKFTEEVTRILATNEVRSYSHLRNDFRLIEVAKLLRFRSAPEETLSYLLNDCPLSQLPVKPRVTGIRRMEQGEATCSAPFTSVDAAAQERAESAHVERYRQEFRGGVEARVEVESADVRRDDGGVLAHVRKLVRTSRRGAGSVWRV